MATARCNCAAFQKKRQAAQLEAALKLRCEDVTTLEAPGPGNRRRQARAAPRGSTIALLRFLNESRRFSHRF